MNSVFANGFAVDLHPLKEGTHVLVSASAYVAPGNKSSVSTTFVLTAEQAVQVALDLYKIAKELTEKEAA